MGSIPRPPRVLVDKRESEFQAFSVRGPVLAAVSAMVGVELASRYRIERMLGEGGMGCVYEAVDLQLDRRVAIKLIRPGVDDPAARARFLREARAAATLSHPNACQLYEVSEHEAEPFLVMEFLEGEPLQARLARGRMSKDEAAAVLLPLMSALTALHDAGLIHRDLKPSNVFLTPQGVKLLDFGLARVAQTSNAQTVAALTKPGAVTGTVKYMSPEQIAGDPLDARTDIFALGVMLFEMVTGRIPYHAATNLDWINAVLTKDPPSLDEPELRSLDAVVARALQRRPDDRYASVNEMAVALQSALSTTGTAAAPIDTSNGHRRAVVLPFRLLHDDPDLVFLRDSVPETLTAMLSDRPSPQMVSNRLAQPFGDATDLVNVGQTLHVDHLLSGSILRAGDEVRVTVQLIDASDGSVQWSHTSEHGVTTALALQDEICREIVERLPDLDARE